MFPARTSRSTASSWGDTLVVTDRGLGEDAMGVARGGRLIRFDVGVVGQKLFRGRL